MRTVAEKILILDRGNLEFAVPRDWTVKPDPAGFLRLEDGTEECLLEVSYMAPPPIPPGMPDVAQRLRFALETSPDGRGAPTTRVDRGDLRLAWAEYPYESDDPRRKRRRPARGRWLIAENGRFQALLTFYYWVDDASWAVPAWERIVATLRLGFGERLGHPLEHWSLREPN